MGQAGRGLLRHLRVPGAVLLLLSATAREGSSESLAGLMPWNKSVVQRWWWSGAWVYPVGQPRDFTLPPFEGGAGFKILRGLSRRSNHSRQHQGIDLSNRQGGSIVRAAANGLVIRARGNKTSGYGQHVVLAHRLAVGGLAYTVYAHLAPGSIQVREGEVVPAGAPLGNVGRTGRASTEHLHFEVRVATDPFQRWELVPPVDPVVFVRDRLPPQHPDSSWAGTYLEWAERSALIAPGANGDQALDRRLWWRMLVRASRLDLFEIPDDTESLRLALVESGLLGTDSKVSDSAIGLSELARDLSRLSDLGVRLPPCLYDMSEHRSLCTTRLGVAPRASDSRRSEGKRRSVTLADACLALAELTGPLGPDPPSGTASASSEGDSAP